MKYTWEEDDLIAGTRVKTKDAQEVWMLGYCHWSAMGNKDRVMISTGDGCVANPMTKKELLEFLNEGKYMPLPKEPNK